jgi:N-methylhydantoinase A
VDFALEGIHDTALYDYARLEPHMTFSGPAIIEDTGCTIVVHPGNSVRVDHLGNLHITIGTDRAAA